MPNSYAFNPFIGNLDSTYVLPSLTNGAVLFFDSTTNDIGEDPTKFFWSIADERLNIIGNIFVGSSLPIVGPEAKLRVFQELIDPASSENSGQYTYTSLEITANTTVSVGSERNSVTAQVATGVTMGGGVFSNQNEIFRTDVADDGTISAVVGTYNTFTQSSTGTTSLYAGFLTGSHSISDGTVTSLADFYALASTTAGATITNRFGIYIEPDSGLTKQSWLPDWVTLGGTTFATLGDALYVQGDARIRNRLLLQESGGTDFISLQAPSTSGYNLTMPAAAPAQNGIVLESDSTGQLSWANPGATLENLAHNASMRFWQRGISLPVLAATRAYGADRWSVNNTSDVDATIAQVAGMTDARYAMECTFDSTGTTGNMEFWQILDSSTSWSLNGQTSSFSAFIKAAGNVTEVGIQFFYDATTETLPTNAIGSEQIFAINSSNFGRKVIDGQAIGNVLSTGGCIGVRIRITQVSSGDIFDAGNGFILTKAVFVPHHVAPPFKGIPSAQDLAICQRFFYKTYTDGVDIGDITEIGMANAYASATSNATVIGDFKTTMRTEPTVTLYNPGTGASGSVRSIVSASDFTASAGNIGDSRFSSLVAGVSFVATDVFGVHYTADAEI